VVKLGGALLRSLLSFFKRKEQEDMSLAKGSVSKLGYYAESSFGEAASTASNFLRILFNSESLSGNRELYTSEDLRSDRMKPGSRSGNRAAGGQITMDFKPFLSLDLMLKSFGLDQSDSTETSAVLSATTAVRGDYYHQSTTSVWLCSIGGAIDSGELPFDETKSQVDLVSGARFIRNTTVVGPLTYTDKIGKLVHTGKSALTIDSITIEKQILGGTANLYERYVGTRMNTVGFNFQQRGNAKVVMDLLAKSVDSGSASYSAAIVSDPLLALLPVAGDPVVIGSDCFLTLSDIGTGVAEVRPYLQASLNLNNNIDGNAYVMSQDSRFDLPEGQRLVTGSFVTYFKDRLEYNAFRDKKKVGIKLSVGAPDAVYWEFAIAEATLSGGGSPTITGAGALQTTFNFEAFIQSGSSDFTLTMKYVLP
jgi:hypothetical protein